MRVDLSFDDEWYPVHDASFPGDDFFDEESAVEVPDEVATRWKRVLDEFSALQRELEVWRTK